MNKRLPIPNILTALRIALCLPLLLAELGSPLFFIIYLCCGLSDILDGYIARKTGAVSERGALLDSLADLLFIAVILAKFLPFLSPQRGILYWILAIALLRFATLALGYYKYHCLAFLHTYANKAVGMLLFCLPLFFAAGQVFIGARLICGLASLAALEELAITIKSPLLARDRKSFLHSR